MFKGSEGFLERLWRAEQLMNEGKVDEASPLIESLDRDIALPPDARLTYQLLKSQLMVVVGTSKPARSSWSIFWSRQSLQRKKKV